MFIHQWDRLYDLALKGESGSDGEGWKGEGGRLWLDCLPCKLRSSFFQAILMEYLTTRGKLPGV